ncbi:MAG: hypothetical protein LBJ08_06565, partial [Bifidobacteriaceae bacterium]|nr:hypothetical protein [Bifidobacteriaceae bacterium]
DHTATYQHCFEDSSYTPPNTAADPADDLEWNQKVADVTNEWIACAREHGQPDLEDLTATANESVQVILPRTTTVAELRALIEACPTFDEEQARAVFDTEGPPPDFEYHPDPAIAIEPPDDPTEEAHWQELYRVLQEKSEALVTSLDE